MNASRCARLHFSFSGKDERERSPAHQMWRRFEQEQRPRVSPGHLESHQGLSRPLSSQVTQSSGGNAAQIGGGACGPCVQVAPNNHRSHVSVGTKQTIVANNAASYLISTHSKMYL